MVGSLIKHNRFLDVTFLVTDLFLEDNGNISVGGFWKNERYGFMYIDKKDHFKIIRDKQKEWKILSDNQTVSHYVENIG